MYKQIIIARKDLNMSPGKLAAQVSHGSMAFLSMAVRRAANQASSQKYSCLVELDKDLYEQWMLGAFTKCVLQAKNKNQLMKAVIQ